MERRTQWSEYGDIMTTAELQEILDLSKDTLLKIIHQPGFPKIRVHNGRKYIYVKSALMEYFHKQSVCA